VRNFDWAAWAAGVSAIVYSREQPRRPSRIYKCVGTKVVPARATHSKPSMAEKGFHLKLDDVRLDTRCAVCWGTMRKVKCTPCAHRFCGACVEGAFRKSGRECPVCRAHIPTRRHLRDDPDFDAVVTALYAGAGDYDAREDAYSAEVWLQRDMDGSDDEEGKHEAETRMLRRAALERAGGHSNSMPRAEPAADVVCDRPYDRAVTVQGCDDPNIGARVDVHFTGDEAPKWYAGTLVAVIRRDELEEKEVDEEDATNTYRVIFDDFDDREFDYPSTVCRLRAGSPRMDAHGVQEKIEELERLTAGAYAVGGAAYEGGAPQKKSHKKNKVTECHSVVGAAASEGGKMSATLTENSHHNNDDSGSVSLPYLGKGRKLCQACKSVVGSPTRICPHCNATLPMLAPRPKRPNTFHRERNSAPYSVRGVVREGGGAGAAVSKKSHMEKVLELHLVGGAASEGGGASADLTHDTSGGQSNGAIPEVVTGVVQAPDSAAAATALETSAGGKHWQWPSINTFARQLGKRSRPPNGVLQPCVYLLAAPAGSAPPALTSSTSWIVAKRGAVLCFANGTLMMMDDCYQEIRDKERAMAEGRLVVTRKQLRDNNFGLVLKVPDMNPLIFMTEEDAEARELFLTEQRIALPMDNLTTGDGNAFCDVRHSMQSMSSIQWKNDVKKVLTGEFDSHWKPKALGDRAVRTGALSPVDAGTVLTVASAVATPRDGLAIQRGSGDGRSVAVRVQSHAPWAAKRHKVSPGDGNAPSTFDASTTASAIAENSAAAKSLRAFEDKLKDLADMEGRIARHAFVAASSRRAAAAARPAAAEAERNSVIAAAKDAAVAARSELESLKSCFAASKDSIATAKRTAEELSADLKAAHAELVEMKRTQLLMATHVHTLATEGMKAKTELEYLREQNKALRTAASTATKGNVQTRHDGGGADDRSKSAVAAMEPPLREVTVGAAEGAAGQAAAAVKVVEDAAETVEKAWVTFEATMKDTNTAEAAVEGLSDYMEGTVTSAKMVDPRLAAVKLIEDPILDGDVGIGRLASVPAPASALALALAPPDSVGFRATDEMDDVDDEYNIECFLSQEGGSVDRSHIAVAEKELKSRWANAEPRLSDMPPETANMMSAVAEAAVAGDKVAEADSLHLALSPRPVHTTVAAKKLFPSAIVLSKDDKTDGSCYVCGLDDEVDGLLCDGCHRVYHMHCLRLETVPKGDWFCPGCTRRGVVRVKGGWRRERGGGFHNKDLQKLERWRLVENGDTIKVQVFAKYKYAAVPVWRDLFDILAAGGFEMASAFGKQHEINHPHLWRTGVRRFDGAVLSPFVSVEYQTTNTDNEDPHQPYYVVYSDTDWENLSEREMETAAELQLRMSLLV